MSFGFYVQLPVIRTGAGVPSPDAGDGLVLPIGIQPTSHDGLVQLIVDDEFGICLVASPRFTFI